LLKINIIYLKKREISKIKKNINKFNGLGRKVFGDFVNRVNEWV
jgi:hypothetical protein